MNRESTLMDLFAPPPEERPETVIEEEEDEDDDDESRRDTLRHSNGETSLDALFQVPHEQSPLMTGKKWSSNDHTDPTPKTGTRKTVLFQTEHRDAPSSSLPAILEIRPPSFLDTTISSLKTRCELVWQPSTVIGAFMFLLYHVVFCLTMGSTITRPHGQSSMLGLMTKMAALGTIFGAPVYWSQLLDIPALYPTVDLFTAPFLANIAVLVDEALYNDPDVSDEQVDMMFLGSFAFLTCLAVALSGALISLASVFKLANLGSYLPFPVLCGFFAAVGVLTWTLAFKIDAGLTIGQVLGSGDLTVLLRAFWHHLPSVLVAGIMKYLGPKSPFYVVGLVAGTVASFYVYMCVAGVSRQEMIDAKWFWASSDLVYEPLDSAIGFSAWVPPAPFGLMKSLWEGQVHWKAVSAGLETTMALSFLYLIRCSLHGAALKKNVPTLSRKEKETMPELGPLGQVMRDTSTGSRRSLLSSTGVSQRSFRHRRKFSEVIDIENLATAVESDSPGYVIVQPKPTNHSLKDILAQYGNSQLVCAIVGGFPVAPSVAASPTMYLVRAPRYLLFDLSLGTHMTRFRSCRRSTRLHRFSLSSCWPSFT